MYYIVSEIIYIGIRFLKDCCYFHQIMSAVAKEYLIPYNLTQTALETQNIMTPNPTPKCHSLMDSPQNKSNKCKIQLRFFERQLLLHSNIENKNTRKLIFQKLILQNGLELNVSNFFVFFNYQNIGAMAQWSRYLIIGKKKTIYILIKAHNLEICQSCP